MVQRCQSNMMVQRYSVVIRMSAWKVLAADHRGLVCQQYFLANAMYRLCPSLPHPPLLPSLTVLSLFPPVPNCLSASLPISASVYLSVCAIVSISICLSVCLSSCLNISSSICLSICLTSCLFVSVSLLSLYVPSISVTYSSFSHSIFVICL